MNILEKDIIVEIDKRVAISFNKKYKDLDLKVVKKEITEYLRAHRNHFEGKEIFSFVYSYDEGIAVTVMKQNPEYEVYSIIGFADMVSPEETVEDDEEKAETREQIRILQENEKIQKAREQEGAKQLESIIEGLGE